MKGSGGTGPTPGTIDNPVINSPFVEPTRHFRVVDGQVTGAIEEGRRPSEFFVPVPRPRKASPQLALQFGGGVRQQPNEIVNEIRFQVAKWRALDYPHASSVTKELLAHWRAEDRERRLFFCQIEAVETAIYLTEASEKLGDTKSLNVIRAENERLNDRLPRMAFKMATGSGKTVVMAMLIAWQTLNKLATPFDKRFSTRFLVVTPGITIKDRLRVLLPNDPQTFYRSMELVTPEQLDRLQAATIEITNYHALIRREKLEAASLTKKVLAGPEGDTSRFRETPAEMVRRVAKAFGTAKDIVVLNDEAHHCYSPAPADREGEGSLTVDERSEARQNQEEARVWFDGLRAVRDKLGVRAIYDVSATPFFLKGSGYAEGTLFPWVASDFGLMDAIESGIVKVPLGFAPYFYSPYSADLQEDLEELVAAGLVEETATQLEPWEPTKFDVIRYTYRLTDAGRYEAEHAPPDVITATERVVRAARTTGAWSQGPLSIAAKLHHLRLVDPSVGLDQIPTLAADFGWRLTEGSARYAARLLQELNGNQT